MGSALCCPGSDTRVLTTATGLCYFAVIAPDLSCFGRACYTGYLDLIKRYVESGRAPDLTGKETPYQMGYAMILVLGSIMVDTTHPDKYKHYESLIYLVSKGVPVTVPDIAGFTALHHAIWYSATAKLSGRRNLTYLLLELAADVNYRNRMGESPIFLSFLHDTCENAELLLAFGADLDIADANGNTPRLMAPLGPPKLNALIQRWSLRRTGEVGLRAQKACDACGKSNDVVLKNCMKCLVARYCSKECQRSDWNAHKVICESFDIENAATLVPRYFEDDIDHTVTCSNAVYAYMLQSVKRFNEDPLERIPQAWDTFQDLQKMKNPSSSKQTAPLGPFPKSFVVKIGIPLKNFAYQQRRGDGPLVCFTKKRELVCFIVREDAPEAYDAVWNRIRDRRTSNLEAYFIAQLRSEDELLVKVSDVLADQPF